MKKLTLLISSLLLIINPFINVHAEEPEDEIIVECDEYDDVGFANKYNSNVMYGLDAFSYKPRYERGIKTFIAIKKEEADYGLRYILDNGYPNKSITGDNMMDFEYTSYAILYYMMDMGYVDVNGEFKNEYDEFTQLFGNDFVNYAKQVYNQACVNGDWTGIDVPEDQREMYCNLVKSLSDLFNSSERQKDYDKNYTGEIVLSAASSKLTKSEDEKYYETNWLSVKRNDASKYNIELTNAPEGTIIIGKDGNEKSEFNIDDEFKIRVPADKVNNNQLSFKINIDDNYNTYYIYKSVNKNLHTGMSYKALSLDDYYTNQVYSKPYQKEIKESKEFYLNIDIPTQVVEVPATSAYGSIIIIVLGIICIIISVFAMRKVTNKVIR